MRPLGLKASAQTAAGCKSDEPVCLPQRKSQNVTRRSPPPRATVRSSGLMAMAIHCAGKEMKTLLEQVLLKLKNTSLSKDQQRCVVEVQERIAALDRLLRDREKIIIEEDWDNRPIILRPLPRGKVPVRKLKAPLPKEDGMPELFRDLCLLAQRKLQRFTELRERQNR
jgi:hypothetical protein